LSKTCGLVLDVANQVGGVVPSVVTLHDWSREKNDGAMTNVTWAQLASTGLWYPIFNGTTSLVNCGNAISFSNLNQFTWETWFYANGLGGNNIGRILDKGAKNWHIEAGRFTVNISHVILTGQWKSPVASIALAGWYHVVVTMTDVDNVASNPTFYINGVSVVVTETATPNGALIADTTLYLGNRAAANRGFDGYIPKFRYYNYALTPAQIRARYHAEKYLFGVAS